MSTSNKQSRFITMSTYDPESIVSIKTAIAALPAIRRRLETEIETLQERYARIKQSAGPEAGLIFSATRPSKTRRGQHHLVKFFSDRTASCTCEGYAFRGECRHIADVLNAPGVYSRLRDLIASTASTGVGKFEW